MKNMLILAFTCVVACQSACVSDESCSYNGKCAAASNDGAKACKCRPQWTGDTCATLNLLPAVEKAGYQHVDDGQNTSSWGGPVLYDPADGMYHMWVSEFVNHCGLTVWDRNSQIVHATSKTPGGTYTREEVVFPVFSHEPTVVRANTGEFVMFFTAKLPPVRSECKCKDGFTNHSSDCPPLQPGANNLDASYMSYAKTSSGPWSAPVEVMTGAYDPPISGGDTNLAPVINADGSLTGLWRVWTGPSGSSCCSHVFSVTASNWKDPSSYKKGSTPQFPQLTGKGTEDPFVYVQDGVYHGVFHHMNNSDGCQECGGHAYSVDGNDWTYTGVCFGPVVKYTDGSSYKFKSRERPHIVFDATGKMTHLTTGVGYGVNDGTFTHVQPIDSGTISRKN